MKVLPKAKRCDVLVSLSTFISSKSTLKKKKLERASGPVLTTFWDPKKMGLFKEGLELGKFVSQTANIYPVSCVLTLTQHGEWSRVGGYSEVSPWRNWVVGKMAKIIRQKVPLLVTFTGAQGRETAVTWVVKEGNPKEVGFQRWVLYQQRVGVSVGGPPLRALLFVLSRRGADGHRLADG